ncbi:hypothetical protein GCM10027423_01090 [Spirosoma arcticum]
MNVPLKNVKNDIDKRTGETFIIYIQQVSKLYQLPASLERRMQALAKSMIP